MSILKKVFLAVCSVCLVLASGVGSVFAFDDFASTHNFATAIDFLAGQGIVSGYPDGTYRPASSINRAEFLKIVVGAKYGTDESVLGRYRSRNCISDVEPNQWYTPYICLGIEKGIVSGYPDGTFKPSANINSVEALKIVLKTFEHNVGVEGDPWFKVYIDAASVNNFIPLDVVSFSQLLNRGQMADLITRVMKLEDGNLDDYLGERASYRVTYGTMVEGKNVENEYQAWASVQESSVGVPPIFSFCVDEGESLGAVLPDNDKECCSGLVPFIGDEDVVGTRGICVDENSVPVTKQRALAVMEAENCFYDLSMDRVSLDLDGDVWTMSMEGCGGVCTVNGGEEFFMDVNQMCTGLIEPVSCVEEGGSLGAVVPGNDKECCEGFVPYIEDAEMVGTRGICVDENDVPLTKQEALTLLDDHNCIYDLTMDGVSFDLDGDVWTMSKEGCGGICTVNRATYEWYTDYSPMCTGS